MAKRGLRGWTRVKGSSRYRNPQGRIVSRRQYDNARAKKAGYSSYSAFQREKRSSEYQRYMGAAIASGARKRDFQLGAGGFTDKYAAARRSRWSTDPDGEFADFLVHIGLREPDWEYDVGDTPQGEGSK